MNNDLVLETEEEILITDLLDKTIGVKFVRHCFTKKEFTAILTFKFDYRRGNMNELQYKQYISKCQASLALQKMELFNFSTSELIHLNVHS